MIPHMADLADDGSGGIFYGFQEHCVFSEHRNGASQRW